MITASARLRRIQRHSLCLITLAGTLNFIDRSALAVANPLIRTDLGLSVGEMGLLLSAFLWVYALAHLPAGALVDRFGPRRLLAASIFAWSLAQGLGGLVTGFGQFVAARGLLGVTEAPLFPSLVRVVRDWYPAKARGLPTGIGFSANKIGPALAPMVLTPLMLSFGWRWMFILLGLAGIFMSIAWYWTYRDARDLELTAAERNHLDGGTAEPPAQRVTWQDWKQLFRYRATWGMLFGLFGAIYMGWVYQTWLPGYLAMERKMSLSSIGWVAGIPFACGVIGAVGAGWLTDRLAARGVSPVNSCKVPIVAGLVGMAGFTIVAALTPSTWVAMIAISLALTLNGMTGAMAITLASVVAPRQCAASLHGIQNCGGFFGGALAPAITGFIVQGTGSFVPALLFSAGMGLVSALIYVFVVPNRPIDPAGFSRAS